MVREGSTIRYANHPGDSMDRTINRVPIQLVNTRVYIIDLLVIP